MARAKNIRNGAEPTRAAAIEEAVRTLGGADGSDNAKVSQYIRNKYGIDASQAEINQAKTKMRTKYREREHISASPLPPNIARRAQTPEKRAVEAMRFEDIRAISRLVREYGVTNVIDVARAVAFDQLGDGGV